MSKTGLTLDAIVRDVYTAPVEDGMPPSSKLGNGLIQGGRGEYVVTMYAPAFDVYSYSTLEERELKRCLSSPGAMVALMERKLGQLRQRHHFACMAKRGGFY